MNGGLSIPEGQFGRKVGKYAAAFGLDASTPEHKERLRAMTGEIYTSPDVVVEGNFRGQGRVRFFVKEGDVVVATLSDGFVTFLKVEFPIRPSGKRCKMSDEISRIVGEAIGRRLMKVAASAHLFEGKMDDAPIDLWLFFEGMSPLRIFGEPDGWRLSVDRRPPEPLDMDESGEVVVGDVSAKTLLGAVIGESLEGAWLVESSGEAVGVRLDFGLTSKPLIINLDDELLVLDEYPIEAEEFTETRIRPTAVK